MPPLIAFTHLWLLVDERFALGILRCAQLLLDHGFDPNGHWINPSYPEWPLSVLYGAAGMCTSRIAFTCSDDIKVLPKQMNRCLSYSNFAARLKSDTSVVPSTSMIFWAGMGDLVNQPLSPNLIEAVNDASSLRLIKVFQ
jgi:hypothetical protein